VVADRGADKPSLMRLVRFFGLVVWLSLFLCACETTRRLWATLNDFAVGTYKATSPQTELADQRATAAFARFSTEEKSSLQRSGVRYLAVRTAGPTPVQWTEIRRDMQRPTSRYSGPRKVPEKIYCVMIWDTQSQEIVGTDCYAVLKLPPAGELARFDTYTAQYVGF
jgi:hypothetical protein